MSQSSLVDVANTILAPEPVETETVENKGETQEISKIVDRQIRTLEDLIEVCQIDTKVWTIYEWSCGKWDVWMKSPAYSEKFPVGPDKTPQPMWQRDKDKLAPVQRQHFKVKAKMRLKSPQVTAAHEILEAIKNSAPPLKIPTLRKKILPHRRALELCLMDLHLGLLCQRPEADAPWDLELASAMIMSAIDDLLEKAAPFGPFEEVIMPFGNDFTHSDTVLHQTTAGTPQPESISWHRVYLAAQELAIAMVMKLRKIGKRIRIYQVPGNHSRQSDFTLALMLKAYFHADKNVEVDASSRPYKFCRYGCNLIGYEHGHSVKPIRLAALMANECSKDWHETEYREFHLGDQHRKGSSKPSMLEEQGVSIEYIPGLTAPNEWHTLKSFSHQKRGAMAYVWDHATGPVARFQFNISQYTHAPLGVSGCPKHPKYAVKRPPAGNCKTCLKIWRDSQAGSANQCA